MQWENATPVGFPVCLGISMTEHSTHRLAGYKCTGARGPPTWPGTGLTAHDQWHRLVQRPSVHPGLRH